MQTSLEEILLKPPHQKKKMLKREKYKSFTNFLSKKGSDEVRNRISGIIKTGRWLL